MARMGDNSFEAVAMPHLEAAFRLARRLARDEHEAEDLVQESFLKAFQAFGGFEMREFGIRPWLLKILYNAFLNRRARERNAPRAADQQTLESHAESGTTLPDLDHEHLDEEVKHALNTLAPEFRSVMLLWATMELSYKEIAEILSLPVGTVMSRLYRARAQLAASLAGFARRNRLPLSEGSR